MAGVIRGEQRGRVLGAAAARGYDLGIVDVAPEERFPMELERIEQYTRGWAVEFADKNGGVPVAWSRVVIVERPTMPSDDSLEGARLYTPEEYAPRFAQIAREARCDWINFGAEGVLGDALVLIVDHGWGYPVGRTPGHLHVMPCGPRIVRGFVKYQEPGQ